MNKGDKALGSIEQQGIHISNGHGEEIPKKNRTMKKGEGREKGGERGREWRERKMEGEEKEKKKPSIYSVT